MTRYNKFITSLPASVFLLALAATAPSADGSMAFLGVEYSIPAEDWSQAMPPEFFGRELHFNPVLEILALHVWSVKDNPTGMFEDFNPDVSCEFAQD